jgi:hypothetical protein
MPRSEHRSIVHRLKASCEGRRTIENRLTFLKQTFKGKRVVHSIRHLVIVEINVNTLEFGFPFSDLTGPSREVGRRIASLVGAAWPVKPNISKIRRKIHWGSKPLRFRKCRTQRCDASGCLESLDCARSDSAVRMRTGVRMPPTEPGPHPKREEAEIESVPAWNRVPPRVRKTW